jgi:hypothetical protein
MASLEEFRFGRLDEKPSSFHEIRVLLKKYEIRFEEYISSEGRLSSQDSFVRYTSNTGFFCEIYKQVTRSVKRYLF